LDVTCCSQICECSSTFLKSRVLGLSYGLKLTSWLSVHFHIQVLKSNMFRSLPPISKWVLGVEGESWNLCNGSNEVPFVNDELAFLNCLQHTTIILSISFNLMGLWHTSLRVNCLLLCIRCKLHDIILRVVLLYPLRFQWVVWYYLEGLLLWPLGFSTSFEYVVKTCIPNCKRYNFVKTKSCLQRSITRFGEYELGFFYCGCQWFANYC
jgi:hypothetical protein